MRSPARPASIAPLLTQLEGRASRDRWREARGAGAPSGPESRQRFEQEVQYWASRYERKRARKEAHRAARRAKREARRRQRGQRMVPWPFSMVLAILFTVSIVMVAFATQLVVPFVLLVLSVFFGRAMRDAAETVREAGKSAVEGIHRSRQWLRGDVQREPAVGHDGEPLRIDDAVGSPAERVRVGPEAPGADEQSSTLEDEDSWPEADGRARR
jgi:hypothetical protein